ARFELPPDLPPSYRGRNTGVAYELEVRVDIQRRRDRRGRYEVVMLPPRLGPPPPQPPLVLCTDARGPIGERPYMEASLDGVDVEPGGIVAGRVALFNLGHDRVE